MLDPSSHDLRFESRLQQSRDRRMGARGLQDFAAFVTIPGDKKMTYLCCISVKSNHNGSRSNPNGNTGT